MSTRPSTGTTPAAPERAPGASGRPGFREVMAKLDAAQKPGEGVPAYMRWVNRRVARAGAAAAVALGLSANAVSWISLSVSLIGLAVLIVAPIAWWTGLVVAVLLALGFALDSSDGQVARVTGTGSVAGEWLDHVIDAVRTPAIHLAVLVALYRHHAVADGWLLLPILYTLVSVGIFMSQILAEQLRRGRLASDALAAANAAASAPVVVVEAAVEARLAQPGVEASAAPVNKRRDTLRSFLLLPTDFGMVCWMFVFWGFTPVFVAVYALMLLINGLHFPLSAFRKYMGLTALNGGAK